MAKTDFNVLWNRLNSVAESRGDSRLKALLKNFESKKELVCRKLGVISEADIRRIDDKLRSRRP